MSRSIHLLLAAASISLIAATAGLADELTMAEFQTRRAELRRRYVAARTADEKAAILDEFRRLDLARGLEPADGEIEPTIDDATIAGLAESLAAVGGLATESRVVGGDGLGADASLATPTSDASYFDDADELLAPADGKPAALKFVAHEESIATAVGPLVRSVRELDENMMSATESDGARLVPLAPGRKDRPMTVTVHGINASPDAVRSLSGRAARAGHAVRTLAYDDRGRSLETSARGLAADLGRWLDANPGRTLRVDAHSMGGRVALRALDLLQAAGRLEGRRVELNLIASPIDGVGAADLMHVLPPIVGPLVRMAVGPSSVDMAPLSSFQSTLDRIRFESNVRVRVFTGGKDGIVSGDGDFETLAGRWNATRVHFPNADHDTAVEMAAAWLDARGE